jgi:cytochrome d ubiquinol oxidase subunit II
MHGAIYLVMKTEGELHDRIRSWAKKAIAVFVVLYLAITAFTIITIDHMTANFREYPVLLIIPVLNFLAITNIFREFRKGRDGRAFISSCVSIVLLMLIFGIGIFPNLVWSIPEAANSLSIYNASSSDKTLKIMLIIAVIGMPLVLAYTASIYWIFRGKVKLDSTSY